MDHFVFTYFDSHKHKEIVLDCGPKNERESLEKAIELKREHILGNVKRTALENRRWQNEAKFLAGLSHSTEDQIKALDIRRNAQIHEPQIYFKSSEKMEEVENNSVQLIVTSPPYNVGKDYFAYDDRKALNEYLDFLDVIWAECKRVLCKGGRIAINVADTWRQPYVPLHCHITERILMMGLQMRGVIYWNKGVSVGISTAWGSWKSPSNPTIRDVGEYILVFSKDSFKLESPNKTVTMTSNDFTEYTKSVWDFAATNGAKNGHPAPFPEELPRRLINFYTYLGDTVLDPFLGSGTTCKVAKAWGRKSIGYEIDKNYKTEIQQKIRKTSSLAIPIDTFLPYERVPTTLESLLSESPQLSERL